MAKRKPKRQQVEIAEPTPEQFARGQYTRLTMAYRRTPVIDTLVETGKLTARQHHGLSRYRDIAIAHEKSPMRDSLDKALQGRGGSGAAGDFLHTAYELQRLDNALGGTRDIVRAVAVDDMTVSQWAAERGGTTADGRPKRAWVESGMIDIKAAGIVLAKAVGA